MKKLIILLLAGALLYSCTPQDRPTAFTDSRDGKVYKMVTIGEQTWMAENLAYLTGVVGPATVSNTEPYYYVYGYDGTDVSAAKATTNYQTYGVLYNWRAALTACPDGWHLPSDAEWKQLEIYLATNGYNYDGTIGSEDEFEARTKIGKSLATDSGWDSSDVEGAVGNTDYPAYRNKSGFSALPGGYLSSSGRFREVGFYGAWWNSTEHSGYAWYRVLYFNSSAVDRYDNTKGNGFSVRCLRDE
ncbi:MAG TPA: FISUMP domain-containing protein [Desulfobacteraceae bacterium]|nr:FISUMP domain-containing protein [Desulfobacteraceae bacterium]HRW95217.1 FISUMP domain-containing protein [Bacteroidales bacterium]